MKTLICILSAVIVAVNAIGTRTDLAETCDPMGKFRMTIAAKVINQRMNRHDIYSAACVQTARRIRHVRPSALERTYLKLRPLHRGGPFMSRQKTETIVGAGRESSLIDLHSR